MVEKLQNDSLMDLSQHLQEVTGALIAAGQGGDKPAATDVSMFMAPGGGQGGVFVGDGTNTASKALRVATPLVPLTYSERVNAASRERKGAGREHTRADIFGKTENMSKSLRPIKGAAITPAMAAALGVGYLIEELAKIQEATVNPYANAPRRLERDLLRGDDRAEELVHKRPEVVERTVPKIAEKNRLEQKQVKAAAPPSSKFISETAPQASAPAPSAPRPS